METTPVIKCSGVVKHFGDTLAVYGVSFDLSPGEIVSILGPSGCGKTTILRLIAGFERVDSGEIIIQGQRVSGSTEYVPPERRNVGMVFQEYALFPHMTVLQNVAFGLQGMARLQRDQRLADVIELVRLAGLETRYPNELSGGQQQRVALARTLAPRPVTVLLDEPFSNLDASMRSEMRQEVERILRDNNIATIFVTHDREEAFAMADRVGVMNSGRLEQIDAPDAIYHRPATRFVAQLTGTCDFLRGQARGSAITTDIGLLPFTSKNGPLSEDTQVELLIRPDDFRILPDERGRSVVQAREFRGDETVLVVATPSGETLRCRQRSYSRLSPGTRVTLELARDEPFLAFKG
jgi:iron(III) transport system ATP-binding protein